MKKKTYVFFTNCYSSQESRVDRDRCLKQTFIVPRNLKNCWQWSTCFYSTSILTSKISVETCYKNFSQKFSITTLPHNDSSGIITSFKKGAATWSETHCRCLLIKIKNRKFYCKKWFDFKMFVSMFL